MKKLLKGFLLVGLMASAFLGCNYEPIEMAEAKIGSQAIMEGVSEALVLAVLTDNAVSKASGASAEFSSAIKGDGYSGIAKTTGTCSLGSCAIEVDIEVDFDGFTTSATVENENNEAVPVTLTFKSGGISLKVKNEIDITRQEISWDFKLRDIKGLNLLIVEEFGVEYNTPYVFDISMNYVIKESAFSVNVTENGKVSVVVNGQRLNENDYNHVSHFSIGNIIE